MNDESIPLEVLDLLPAGGRPSAPLYVRGSVPDGRTLRVRAGRAHLRRTTGRRHRFLPRLELRMLLELQLRSEARRDFHHEFTTLRVRPLS